MKAPRVIMAAAIAAAALAFGGTNSASAAATSFSTGFQIQNLSNATANVSISFVPSGSATASATVTTTIPANGAKTYATLPADVAAGFTGGAVINSDQQVAAVVNVLANNSFFYGEAYGGFSAGANSVTVPLLFKGSFGFNSFFNVQNTGTAATDVTVTYSGGGLSASVTEKKTVQPGSSERFDQGTNGQLPAGFNGSAVVSSSSQPVAVAVIENGPTTLLAYNGFVGTSTAPVMPLINANNSGFITGISMQNAGTQATNVTVSYTHSSAGADCTETKAVPAGGTAFFAIDAFAKDNTGETCANGATFVGSARVTANSASQPLIAVVNQLNQKTNKGGAYDSFDAASGTSTVVFPLIQDRVAGYFTGFSIVNVGSAPVNINCTYSNTSVTQSISNLAPNATWTAVQLNVIGNGYNGAGVCTATGGTPKIVGVLNQVATSSTTDAFFVSEAINK
ncbi:MAG TPA: hypothetical protein VFT66_18210 [Roseiflexaceae bacterium]|nr:hypothetical protein [Roseiflexaceae bacterium]